MGDLAFTSYVVAMIVLGMVILGMIAILHMLPKKPSNHEIIIKKLDAIEKTLLELKYR
jgi:hypothetical protein